MGPPDCIIAPRNSPFWFPLFVSMCIDTEMAPALSPQLHVAQLKADIMTTSRHSHRHLSRVATELCDVRLYPVQGETLYRHMSERPETR
jgi:hypothetical protein